MSILLGLRVHSIKGLSSCSPGRAYAPHYKETCLRKEREAQEQLRQKWATFRASDRSYCTKLASLGGVPSYVELLTCLDVAQSAARVRGENAR